MLFALERLYPERPSRVYAIHWIAPLLFGGVDLRITNGRAGKAPRVRVEHFEEETQARTRARALLLRRRAHGYRVIEWTATPYESALLRVRAWSTKA